MCVDFYFDFVQRVKMFIHYVSIVRICIGLCE